MMQTTVETAESQFFPPRPKVEPKIYAYEDTHPQYKGLLKVGYTTRSVQERVAEQYPIVKPGEKPYRIVLEEPAIRSDGTSFTDHEVHRMLHINGVHKEAGEWFRCTVEQVRSAIQAVRTGQLYEDQRAFSFGLRPEQEAAIQKTTLIFKATGAKTTKRPTFYGTAKCVLGKPLQPISWPNAWGGKKSWCSHLSPPCKAPGKRTCAPMWILRAGSLLNATAQSPGRMQIKLVQLFALDHSRTIWAAIATLVVSNPKTNGSTPQTGIV